MNLVDRITRMRWVQHLFMHERSPLSRFGFSYDLFPHDVLTEYHTGMGPEEHQRVREDSDRSMNQLYNYLIANYGFKREPDPAINSFPIPSVYRDGVQVYAHQHDETLSVSIHLSVSAREDALFKRMPLGESPTPHFLKQREPLNGTSGTLEEIAKRIDVLAAHGAGIIHYNPDKLIRPRVPIGRS